MVLGGLVFKAHRLLYHATLGLRVINKKKQFGEAHEQVLTRPEPYPAVLLTFVCQTLRLNLNEQVMKLKPPTGYEAARRVRAPLAQPPLLPPTNGSIVSNASNASNASFVPRFPFYRFS